MASSDENDVSRTVPRRGLVREAPRIGALIVVGCGDDLETLRKPRVVAMDQLTLDIGRRPDRTPSPVPSENRAAWLAIPDATVSGLHARVSLRDGQVFLADLGSSNGTLIKVNGERDVGHDSYVLLGQQLFRLNFG